MKKLNSRGAAHYVALAAVVTGLAASVTYMLEPPMLPPVRTTPGSKVKAELVSNTFNK